MERKIALLGAVLLQAVILMGMGMWAVLPLWTGEPMRLAVEGGDDRDLFRGDYVALDYGFSRLNLDSIPNDLPREGRISPASQYYLEMVRDGGLYRVAGIWRERPDGARVLRVRVRSHGGAMVRVEAGIEAWFTDRETARRMEAVLRETLPWEALADCTVTVTAMVTDDGRARLRDLYVPSAP